EFVALHSGHQPVGNDEDEPRALAVEFVDDAERLLGAEGGLVYEALGVARLELLLDREGDDGLVVHAENSLVGLHPGIPSAAAGNRTRKVVPPEPVSDMETTIRSPSR